ncbi:hypothetical protein UO65_1214 [Actinokineospora spheciospongiae]|uniref:Uncharacterized protein n=1 Tax=Actinokineospora spheciospongiae TaxID=909613 RepID=W7J372_9PSEU|nr:hypothetical protein [Actinokineospora spheciospongiae]EWC63537.1 hypothetical protein UO65_1214 [Actinokineospora spheciospongiae]
MTSKDERDDPGAEIADAEIADGDGTREEPPALSPDLVPEDDDDERAESERTGATASTADGPARRGPNPVLLGAGALAAVALVFAAWFGISWARAAGDEDLALDRTRDEVSRVADAAVVTFNTLDHRRVDEGLDRWEAASTGELHDNIRNGRATSKSTIESTKKSTTAKVLKSAVTQLNDRDGTAQVMTALVRETIPEGGETTTDYLRLQSTLLRTDTGWKLTGIDTVPFTPAS